MVGDLVGMCSNSFNYLEGLKHFCCHCTFLNLVHLITLSVLTKHPPGVFVLQYKNVCLTCMFGTRRAGWTWRCRVFFFKSWECRSRNSEPFPSFSCSSFNTSAEGSSNRHQQPIELVSTAKTSCPVVRHICMCTIPYSTGWKKKLWQK